LQVDLEEPLEQLAKKQHRSKNWIINQSIKAYLESDALEEQRWLETLPAIESAREKRSLPAEEVHNWLDSWGTESESEPPQA